MPVDLLLDIGNTRSKWVTVASIPEQSFKVIQEGQIANYELLENSELPCQGFLSPLKNTVIATIYCSCVGDKRVLEIWQQSFPNIKFLQLRSDIQFSGLQNSYLNPAELGTDRFAGMLGACALYPTTNCLVVSCGTATTIDYLEKGYLFQGGWILPGLELMLQSLGKSTAQLPILHSAQLARPTPVSESSLLQEHQRIELGHTTEQAMSMGVILSCVGAIEHAIHQLPNTAHIILTGGNAALIYPYLKKSVRPSTLVVEPNLIFIGINVWRKKEKEITT